MTRASRWDGGNATRDWRPMLRALLAEHGKPASTGDILQALGLARYGTNHSVLRALRQLVDAGDLRTWDVRGADGGVRRVYQWVAEEMHGPIQQHRTKQTGGKHARRL